jgi:N-acetylglucosaminyldiphosphoundecaprenol N-acetyl-beta-D-mannosaminyltransferase
MSRKVLIISFFVSSNIGDQLLSKQICEQFKTEQITRMDFPTGQVITEVSYRGFQVPPDVQECKSNNLRILLGSIYGSVNLYFDQASRNHIKKQMETVDYVVLGGGNMIMDLGWMPEYTLRSYLYVKIARETGKPIYLLSVGVGPLTRKIHRYFAQRTMKGCNLVFVRDTLSMRICRQLGILSELSGDPAFTYSPYIACKDLKKRIIGVCIGDYSCVSQYMTKDEYINILEDLIIKLRQAFQDYHLCFFSTEIKDYRVITSLMERFPEDESIFIRDICTLDDVISLLHELPVLISMRMHAIIIGMVTRVPCIGIAWQPKVKALFSMMKRENHVFDIMKGFLKIDEIVNQTKKLLESEEQCIEAQERFITKESRTFLNSIDKIRRQIT